MGVSQKSKRVTWAPDANLFQMRLFSSAKPPPESGMGTRAHVRPQPDGEVPPGFEGMKPANLRRVKPSQQHLTKWRCPPKFEVKSAWKVVSGEESTEVESEKQRERRVLEAIYPRPSANPPNPHAPADVGGSIHDDRNTPLVPLTPIEETEAAGHGAAQPHETLSSSQCSANNITHSIPDVAAALASVLSNSDQRNLIDCDLLVRILTNPKILQLLSAAQELNSQPTANNRVAPVNAAPTTGAAGPQRLDVSSTMGVAAEKDVNYYKSLVQQHGGGGGGGQDVPTQSLTKSRMNKPCIFFKSRKGCKNGASCAYQHDTTLPSRQRVSCKGEVPLPSAKRVKFSR